MVRLNINAQLRIVNSNKGDEMKTAIVTVKSEKLNVKYFDTVKQAGNIYKLSNAQYQKDIEETENFTLSETNPDNYPCQIDIINIEHCRAYFFYNPAIFDIDFEY